MTNNLLTHRDSHEPSQVIKHLQTPSVHDVESCSDPACHDSSSVFSAMPQWRAALLERIRKYENSVAPLILPPGRADIGRAAWLLLHTASANFPERPLLEKSVQMQHWLQAFAHLYPCIVCRPGIVRVLDEMPPPPCANRDSLTLWSCEIHNAVNADLGLPQYPCNINQLLKLFRSPRES